MGSVECPSHSLPQDRPSLESQAHGDLMALFPHDRDSGLNGLNGRSAPFGHFIQLTHFASKTSQYNTINVLPVMISTHDAIQGPVSLIRGATLPAANWTGRQNIARLPSSCSERGCASSSYYGFTTSLQEE